jgi:peptidoglycan hydrolase CwlO-like protein
MELFKSMFETKHSNIVSSETNEEPVVAEVSGASYTTYGTRDAGLALGSSTALLPKLHAVYMKLARDIQQDGIKQEERKNKTKQEISGLEAQKVNLEKKIKDESDKLILEEGKIEKLNSEIDFIKANPKSVSGDSFAKASFGVGIIIILLLTLYLFVFYSSAAYSAFFKIFTINDSTIANSIFDAQAIGKALNDGFSELIFIIAIPAVFLGLGFLIHKFSEEKKISSYFKITGLIITTFVFDFIIAYEIVEKIYNIEKGGSFVSMPDMTVSMAIQQINFWLIIFAGFVVYIIWGFVFNFVMQEYEKMDRVRYAIQTKEKKLSEYKSECKKIKEIKSDLESQKDSIQGDIDRLKISLETNALYFNDVREGINNYFSGWVIYMKSTKMAQPDIDNCASIKEKFLDDLQSSEFIRLH